MSIDSNDPGPGDGQKTTALAGPSSWTTGGTLPSADDPLMMPHTQDPVLPEPAEFPPSGFEVVELWWERIQLVLRLRRRHGASIDVDEGTVMLYQTRAGATAPSLAARPATGHVEPDERLVRFNLFAAGDQMPLDAGSWKVMLEGPGGGAGGWSVVPAHPDRFATETRLREFVSGNSMYRVKLAAVDGERPLAVEISLWQRASRRRSLWSIASVRKWWRELRRRAWVRTFTLLVDMLHRIPRRGRVILFTSDSRIALGGNLKLVHQRMVERGLDREFELRFIFRPSIRMRRSFRDRARLVWLLARAEVILLEDYQPAVHQLPSRPDQRIIQLWHAWGAFKTVGYSRMGKPGGPNPYSRVHKNYTFATVSSTHEVPFYAEAFGLPEERIVPTGTPRMDEFLDASNQAEGRRRAYAAVPAARDREVILFAPTFRGGGVRRADYPVEILDLHALHAVCAERDAVAVIKMHPFVPRRIDVPIALRDRIFDASDLPVETNDLLLISDLLITDYSSLVFEYAALGRPMLFFAYDLEEYVATRDFYEPFESFVPGRIVRTFGELLDAVRRGEYEADKVEPFARRHLPDQPGSATDRIIDELILAP